MDKPILDLLNVIEPEYRTIRRGSFAATRTETPLKFNCIILEDTIDKLDLRNRTCNKDDFNLQSTDHKDYLPQILNKEWLLIEYDKEFHPVIKKEYPEYYKENCRAYCTFAVYE